MSKSNNETVLVFCAHSDDQIIGPGGTLAKYAKEGKKVFTFIFSKGELSHPHLKPEVITKIREEEAVKADNAIGGNGVEFFDLKEGNFLKNYDETVDRLTGIIERMDPWRVFTHSDLDALPDHRAVCKMVLDACENAKKDPEVYCFDIWGGFHFNKMRKPRLYVDIRKTFRKKTRALSFFKSQWVARFVLTWTVYAGAIFHGLSSHYFLAERFYKLR